MSQDVHKRYQTYVCLSVKQARQANRTILPVVTAVVTAVTTALAFIFKGLDMVIRIKSHGWKLAHASQQEAGDTCETRQYMKA
jgi:hypothetical protein